MIRLSNLAEKVQGQPMFRILDEAKKLEASGASIVHLELGDPDFDTPANVVEAAVIALRAGQTHYAPSNGIEQFHEAIQTATEVSRGFRPEKSQILVTPGANPIIYLAIACTCNPGEEVIIPDPGFPTYLSSIAACGAIATPVPLLEEYDFKLQARDVLAAVTDKTRLIILNSPSNPTGAIMDQKDVVEIEEFAHSKGIFLLSDEIYARLVFDESQRFYSPSVIEKCKENVILLNGFSKAFAMTGWRLGVAIGPDKVISKMALLLNTIVSCVPPFVQYAGIEALQGDQSQLESMRLAYKSRRDAFVIGLNRIKGVSCVTPTGAMYAFPRITGTGLSSEDFANKCLHEAGVALLPGNFFGGHGEGFVRVTFANTVQNIELAVSRIEKVFA
jgi:aspartate/methionine/tyrosine aminotransferase